jgi:Flagellar hook-length control protein FliK
LPARLLYGKDTIFNGIFECSKTGKIGQFFIESGLWGTSRFRVNQVLLTSVATLAAGSCPFATLNSNALKMYVAGGVMKPCARYRPHTCCGFGTASFALSWTDILDCLPERHSAAPVKSGVPFVTVDLVTATIAPHGPTLEPGSLPRDGTVVQARVIAMLDAATARLAILGQTIDANVPRALQAGTALNVAVVRDGAALKLVMQQDPKALPQQAAAAAAALKADASGLLPAAARATIIAALLGSASALQSFAAEQGTPVQGQPAAPAPGENAAPAAQGAEAPVQGAVQAVVQHGEQVQHELAAMTQDAPAAAQAGTAANPHAAQEAALTLAASPGAPAAQNSGPAILVPFQLPQMAEPVMLRVQQEQEDGADDGGGAEAKRTWTVTLSLDAGALGLVHVGIGLRDGSVSVRLSAGSAEGAAQLSTWLPELKARLVEADFTPGELLAAQAAQAGAPSRNPSYTV